MTTLEIRRLFKADRFGVAICPLCTESRLSINHGKNGRTLVYCHNCGKNKALAILATKNISFRDLYEQDDPRFRPRATA